ncbi:hypothetical protein BsWGS_17693 [Bradybaena similaris]
MFVRKGTTLRKKHQSIRRPRRPSLPPQYTTSDPEVGETSSGNMQTQLTGITTGSNTSSTMTLNEEKNWMHHSKSCLTSDNYQTVSYGSILFQLREAHVESASLLDFLQRIWEIMWQSIAMTILLLLLFGIPVSMLAMGTSYLEECPKEPKIPIYLLVGGISSFIHLCILIWQQKRSRAFMLLDDTKDDIDNEEDDVMTRSYRFTWYILTLFLLIWFAWGNYWLFSIWQPNFTQPLHEPRNWCSRRLYYYTFYITITCYSLFGMSILVFLGCLVAYLCGRLRK